MFQKSISLMPNMYADICRLRRKSFSACICLSCGDDEDNLNNLLHQLHDDLSRLLSEHTKQNGSEVIIERIGVRLEQTVL
jgi:hypothetical protein